MYTAEIMTKEVRTVSASTPLSELMDIFNSVSFRHLLVEENGKLIGVLSDRDVIAHISPFLGTESEREEDRTSLNIETKEIMSKNPITVDSETLIDSASILLIENHISCLPVVDEHDHIQGILSWIDILQFHVYGVDKL